MLYSPSEYTHPVSIFMSKDSPSASELFPKYAIMGFLYFEPLHGYELHRQLHTHLREVWRIPQNQVYNILKRLEKEGLIQTEQQEAPGPHTRTRFALTGTGRSQFERWLYTPTPCSARALRMEFLTRLFFACHIAEDLPMLFIQEQNQAISVALVHLEERLAGVPTGQIFNRLALELRLRQLHTLQTWLQSSEPLLFP